MTLVQFVVLILVLALIGWLVDRYVKNNVAKTILFVGDGILVVYELLKLVHLI